ncbi:sugar ABC transporter ATP-binding protein [Kineosporia sp. J2-2]|uniref:Sugar ABC transporter ATP-binding protein n=1 Tax=Kineosporia corallincola TaxID=2835133 RepID=A0ABS5TQ13_9ACTN|nr:sugar ABC transporter ATP-binding protein [Kineosporia corallincola]MBT0772913.1 sugar ABC transporter ATP-binding protein [Kineosporia corallincola]
MSGAPRLEITGTSKTFGRHRALDDVSLEVVPGEIHALIGQNGSGKSTLAKILTGIHAPDPGGSIRVDGVALRTPVRPLDARAAGVAVVHQNLGLVGHLTVLENLRVGRYRPGRFTRRISRRTERAQVAPLLERLGRPLPLDEPVASLTEADRAAVAIARALQDADSGRGVIVFDESTRSLNRRTMESFYALVDEVVATGTSVLLISHGLEEVIEVADRVTVLRDGRVVAAGTPTTGITETDLARLVLGRSLSSSAPVTDPAVLRAGPKAAVRGLCGAVVRDLDLEVRPGEVLGVTGLPDSGYGEIPYLVSGATPARAGTLTLADRTLDLTRLDVGVAMASGIALVPEGREQAGLATAMSARENILLPASSRRGGRLRPLERGAAREVAQEWMIRLDVRPHAPDLPAGSFSGGNQQKVLLAKWLATRPELLVLHEPGQAVDVGARQAIIATVRAAAASGCAVLVAGGDENELSLLCDRVLVLRDGVVAAELSGPVDPDDVVHATFAGAGRRGLRPSRRPA